MSFSSGFGSKQRHVELRILLLSAYDTTSHRLWRERLQALFPAAHWCQLALPARHFEWRLRSNSLHWGLQDIPELEADWDLLLATSMVDLAALRGLRPRLSRIPTLLYFHENQFFYPDNPGHTRKRETNVEPLLIPVFSALCADKIVFNSEFNRTTFLQGARKLFARLPENLPAAAWRRIEASSVVPVPVSVDATPEAAQPAGSPLQVIWNHRWEFDKGPELLLALAQTLVANNAPVQLHVTGQQFRKQPAQFEEIKRLCNRLSTEQNLDRPQLGFISDRAHYEALLHRCDVVLSTAWHEFQGLGVQEACLAGCYPVVPNDLAYPEYLPPECLYERQSNNEKTAQAIVSKLMRLHEQGRAGKPLNVPSMGAFCGEAIKARYQSLFDELSGGTARPTD